MFGNIGNRDFYPKWNETPPTSGTYRSIFKWGAPDQFKHPNRRLFQMIKETFAMTDADFKNRMKEGNEPVKCAVPVKLSSDQIAVFKNIAGESNVSTDDYQRVRYSNGKTMEEAMLLRNQLVGNVADVVVHPRTIEDIHAIVLYCNDQKIPLYVYGGGSSVNFGVQCTKGGVTLVMQTHMNKVIELNETNHTITVEAGMMGPDYEAALNEAVQRFNTKHSYTGGHFPQSFEYSSVGGWISTWGSGQQSSYYGDACDLVMSQEYVTPQGTFKTLDYPATATGPKLNDIMKGSEGAFGVLVRVTMKIFRYLPQNRNRFAFIFPDWSSAVNATREISQGQFGMPSVLRISDAEETDVALKLYGIEGSVLDQAIKLKGFKPHERCLCIGHTEGEGYFSRNVKKKVRLICNENSGMFLTGLPVKNWEHGRYKDPYLREDLNDYGIMIDTLEAGVTWDNIHNLHQGVRSFVKKRPKTICMTHASHFYPQGTNLYFIFIARMSDINEYKDFQKGMIDNIAKFGGSLSHHHGVGKMIAPWMEEHLGTQQMDVLRALKHHFDPNGIMNPGGTMGLDLSPDMRRYLK
ncbi:MAG: FAD-binding oxidoreductase [Desulfamplus sp.]|nr:FAD-binding oxidoreductase [Desulfamplus sp.]